MRKQRFTDAKIKQALRASFGGVYLAADMLQCSHTTIYNRINASPALREAKEHAEGRLVDIAVAGLGKAVVGGDLDAIKYTLNKKGKQRGFGDTAQVEFSGPNGGPIEMKNECQPISESERLAELVALCDSIRARAATTAGSSENAETGVST